MVRCTRPIAGVTVTGTGATTEVGGVTAKVGVGVAAGTAEGKCCRIGLLESGGGEGVVVVCRREAAEQQEG